MGICASSDDKPAPAPAARPAVAQAHHAPDECDGPTAEERAINAQWRRDAAAEEAEEEEEVTTTSRDLTFEEKKEMDWDGIAAKLPARKTEAEKQKRKDMFRQFDINGNGYLSLAEVDKGLRDVIQCDAIFKSKPAILRAFNAVKDIAPSHTKYSDDYVTFKEFRLLLKALMQMFELFVMFKKVGGADRRISKDEFAAAVPKFEAWGVVISNPDATFAEVDKDGGGMILFKEFVEWGIRQGLDTEQED
eukprot:TRINITY_DN859_c0_g3_i1.p1 TRINITY_DN859_c0_g3~~TRINITY_DN859_c0_g3_i1.p1  ORF type:complete len:248 (+),score=100.41 TRINITY_DN859_c0_g3_i1:67-810(+)